MRLRLKLQAIERKGIWGIFLVLARARNHRDQMASDHPQTAQVCSARGVISYAAPSVSTSFPPRAMPRGEREYQMCVRFPLLRARSRTFRFRAQLCRTLPANPKLSGLLVSSIRHSVFFGISPRSAVEFRDQSADAGSSLDRKSTRLNSSHQCLSRMPSSA